MDDAAVEGGSQEVGAELRVELAVETDVDSEPLSVPASDEQASSYQSTSN